MTKPLCYIGGPVNAMDFSYARDRNRIIGDALKSYGFEPVDPLDFEGAEKLKGLSGNLDCHAERLGITPKAKIVSNCLALIDRCDVVFIEARGLEKPSAQTVGTWCEMMYAWQKNIPVIVLASPDFKSAWLETLATVVHSWSDAVAVLLHASIGEQQVA